VLLLAIAVLATVLGATSSFSSASFTSQSTNAPAIFTAAADWTPPTVTMNSPGSAVGGTVTVSATASDASSGVASVLIEDLGPTGSWTTICTATASPWSCSWNTTAGADGSHALRATATDKAGNVTVSDPVSTTVVNNFTVVLADPGSYLRGTPTLSGAIYGGGSLTYSVTVEYAVSGTTTWKTACSTGAVVLTSFSCAWPTGSLANGSYDLRATATSGRTSGTSVSVTDVVVDNTAPVVTMTDPGATLSGTVTLGATTTDPDSGVSQVELQYAATGTSTWSTACTISSFPYTCRFDTTKLTNARYDFRAVGTDNAGNAATSAAVTGRTVDNTVSSVAMEDPGAYLTGSVTLAATATARTGVASVAIQRSPNGAGSWTTVCTLTGATSPYSCSWSSTTTPDGLYDFRAVLTETGGAVTTSSVVSARRVDNTALRGYDVQATNGGATVGKIEANDTLTLTYTDTVKPGSITPTFTGAALAVQVRFRDGGVLGLTTKDDTVDVLVGGTVVNLGSVNLKEDFVRTGKTSTFNATMSASTTVVGSANRTVITLKLGSLTSGGAVRTVTTAQNMVWSPSTSATDTYGTASSGAPVTELGTLDKDF
jgi:hypothetical protein